MAEVTIFVHVLAHLPHYYPLYMAAYELSRRRQPVRIKFHRGADSLDLFLQAEIASRHRSNDIHLVVSGEHEDVYIDPGAPRSIVDYFVSANLLLSRTPLWAKTTAAKEEEALTLLRKSKDELSAEIANGTFQGKLHLPLARTTLAAEVLNVFPGLNALKTNDPSWKWNEEYVKATSFSYQNDEELIRLLERTGSTIYFSIYPPKKRGKIVALNHRLPAASYGFSAIWVLREQATDRRNLALLVKFLGVAEVFITKLSACDADLLLPDSEVGSAEMDEFLKDYDPKALITEIFARELSLDKKDTAWHGELSWMLRAFNLARIWGYNHALQFRDLAANKPIASLTSREISSCLSKYKFAGFNSYCLTEHLFRAQHETFNSKIKVHLDVLSKESESLDKITDAVKTLMAFTTGTSDSDELRAEGALSLVLRRHIRAIFDGAFHSVEGFSSNFRTRALFEVCLEGACPDKNDGSLQEALGILSEFLTSSLFWIKDRGMFYARLKKLIDFLEACLEVNTKKAQDILRSDHQIKDKNPMLLYELKALSDDLTPGSWILGLGKYNGAPCSTPANFCKSGAVLDAKAHFKLFPVLRKEVRSQHHQITPLTHFGSVKELAGLRVDLSREKNKRMGAHDARIVTVGDQPYGQLHIKLEFSMEDAEADFSELHDLVYTEKQRYKGQSSSKLRRLREMGWRMDFQNAERVIHLVYPKNGVTWI